VKQKGEVVAELKHDHWEVRRHVPGNKVQGGLAGYSIESCYATEGIAYNICRERNAVLIGNAPKMHALLSEWVAYEESGASGTRFTRKEILDMVHATLEDIASASQE
jgi:hypothetical protein